MIDPRQLGARCDDCPRKGQTPVPPEGPAAGATVCWVGQDPGKTEVALGRPFVGATGQRITMLWEEACRKAGRPIPRKDIFITNGALCLPVKQKDDKEARRAADCCRPRLMAEIRRLHPHAGILVMGRWAYYALTFVDKHVGKFIGFHQQYNPEEFSHAEARSESE